MAFSMPIMTNKGIALQAKAQAGTELIYTRIAVGDGSLGGQSIPNLTALISQKKNLVISKLKTLTGGKAVVGTILSNEDIVTGFDLREIGVFALDPDEGEILYCYTNAGAGAEYINPSDGTNIVEKYIDIIAVVGNASNVTATIDDTLVMVTQKDLANAITDGLARQAIINGNFDVAQRGLTFTNPTNAAYTLDRYHVVLEGTFPTVTHTQQKATPGELPLSSNHYRLTTSGTNTPATDNRYMVGQKIEGATRIFGGSKITVSFWARSSIAGKKLGLFNTQNYGSGGSPSANENLPGTNFTLSTTWTKCSFTLTTNSVAGKTFGTNKDDSINIYFMFMWGAGAFADAVGSSGVSESFRGAGTIDIAQVQVNTGDVSLPFQPRSFGDELALCQRYYEKSYLQSIAPGSVSTFGGSFENAGSTFTVFFKATKRVPPTVSFYSPTTGAIGKARDAGAGVDVAAVLGNGGDSTVTVNTSPVTLGNGIAFQWTADAEL